MSKKKRYTQAELDKLLEGPIGPEALYDLGTQIRQNTDTDNHYQQAMACFKRAADLGYPPALNDLGTMFREGFGCDSNIPEAIKWYERAAELGEAIAFYNLATIYLHGTVAPQNYQLAAEYLEQALELDCMDAASDLGTMYRFGHGVKQDFVKASKLHHQAANSGDYIAMANLCDYYHELFVPAMNGSLVASKVLYHIYKKGYGDDSDPAVAWAWIRWAYDVCLPLTPHEFLDSEHCQLYGELEQACTSTDPATRDEGDKYLFRVMTECESHIEPSWQPVLIVGGEGAIIRLMGQWWMDGWHFRRDVCDGSLAILDDNEPVFRRLSDIQWRWNGALELLDSYPLHQLHPIYVHPEFQEGAIELIREKAAQDASNIASEELWMNICCREL